MHVLTCIMYMYLCTMMSYVFIKCLLTEHQLTEHAEPFRLYVDINPRSEVSRVHDHGVGGWEISTHQIPNACEEDHGWMNSPTPSSPGQHITWYIHYIIQCHFLLLRFIAHEHTCPHTPIIHVTKMWVPLQRFK